MLSRVCLMFAAVAALAAGRAAADGARVHAVDAALAGGLAGIVPDDRLIEARGADGSRMPLRDPFDALVAEARYSRLGAVALRLDSRERTLQPDAWGLDYDTVRDAATAATLDAAASAPDATAFCEAAANAGAALAPRDGAWQHWRCSRLAATKRDWPRARAAYVAVHDALRDDADARLAVSLAYARLAQSAKAWPELDFALAQPRSRTELPEIEWQVRQQAAIGQLSRSRFAESAAEFEAMAGQMPAAYRDTLLEAHLRVDHGFALRQLERFDEAEKSYLRAIELFEASAPAVSGAAAAHMSLGLLRRAQGRPSEARKEIEQALAITRRIAPASTRLSATLNNLSLVLWDEGDFIGAERAQAEALGISQQLGPGGHDVAVSLQNLGAMAIDRGDHAAAETHLRQAQAIFERVAPESNSLALGHHHLAQVESQRGDYAAAGQNYRRAIDLFAKLAPGTLREAWSHHNLGSNARKQGRLDEARTHFLAAQAIRSKVAPGGLDEARGFAALGSLERARGERLAARGHLGLARTTLARIAPESEHLAVVLHSLGELERDDGHAAPALARFCEAERVLDLQRRRVSVSRESQSEYAAQHYAIPRDCALARLRAGEPGAALDVIERSRARALRGRLGDFRIAFSGLPDALRDERTDLSARRARLEARLAAAPDAAERDAAARELDALQQDERAWQARLAARAPRLARALDTEVPDHRALLARVPVDAAVVVYLGGEKSSQAWLLSGAEKRLHVAELAVDAAGLAKLAGDLRRAIVQRVPEAALRERARAAHDLLLGPFEAPLGKARRLLLVPDQGMTLLPYAALVRADGRYLLESHDLALAPSVAVALERPLRDDRAPPSLAAVAVTPARALDTGGARVDFAAIPAAAAEVAAIAAGYGARSEVLVDAQATEAQVRAAAARASIVHIASHGFFDARRPLDSGLLLTPAAQDDGVLHAWEVMAGWNLEDTRLVVLSACDTGVGEERAGEGLIGLGRAFQYAGAQGVVASLWPVADKSTAALMQDLHRALLAGAEPAAALQAAQRTRLRAAGGDASATRGVGGVAPRDAAATAHPYFWAGFEVFGPLP